MLMQRLPNEKVSPLFQAVIEATEEAIYNSLFMATSIAGYNGASARALPIDRVLNLLYESGRLDHNTMVAK